jgi:hypothetical protein
MLGSNQTSSTKYDVSRVVDKKLLHPAELSNLNSASQFSEHLGQCLSGKKPMKMDDAFLISCFLTAD